MARSGLQIAAGRPGIAYEPEPKFRQPDSISPTRIKEYPVNIPTFILMLKDTSNNYANPGNYRIGISGLARQGEYYYLIGLNQIQEIV